MQAIFTEVINGDIDAVRARLEKKPELVNAVATGSPRKYTGQSLLQVALRNEQYPIVQMLLSLGGGRGLRSRCVG